MLPLSMFFLISSLSCGVFGFGAGAAPALIIARAMFFVCLIAAMATLAYAVRVQPHRLATDVNERSYY